MRSFSHAKSYRVSFRFTPKLSDQVVVITEESDFYTRYCRNKLHDSKKGKNGDLQICRYTSLFEMSLKMGSTVHILKQCCIPGVQLYLSKFVMPSEYKTSSSTQKFPVNLRLGRVRMMWAASLIMSSVRQWDASKPFSFVAAVQIAGD